jgi:hypothetical protein
MKERSEDVEKASQHTNSQGLAREAYPVRYVDRANPRMRMLAGF